MKTISREDLKEKIDRGDDFVLLEVLSDASYNRAHLPGAIRFQNMGMIPDLLTDKSTRWWRTARTSTDTPRRGSSGS